MTILEKIPNCDQGRCTAELEKLTETQLGSMMVDGEREILTKMEFYICKSRRGHIYQNQVVIGENDIDIIPYASEILTAEELVEYAPNFKGYFPIREQKKIAGTGR